MIVEFPAKVWIYAKFGLNTVEAFIKKELFF
jgi:hypothetical protein